MYGMLISKTIFWSYPLLRWMVVLYLCTYLCQTFAGGPNYMFTIQWVDVFKVLNCWYRSLHSFKIGGPNQARQNLVFSHRLYANFYNVLFKYKVLILFDLTLKFSFKQIGLTHTGLSLWLAGGTKVKWGHNVVLSCNRSTNTLFSQKVFTTIKIKLLKQKGTNVSRIKEIVW